MFFYLIFIIFILNSNRTHLKTTPSFLLLLLKIKKIKIKIKINRVAMGSILLDSKTLPPSHTPCCLWRQHFFPFLSPRQKHFFGAPPFLFIFRDTSILVGGRVGGLFSQKVSKPVAFLSFHHSHKLGFQNPFIKLVLLDLPACSLICVPVVFLSLSLSLS